MGSLSFSAYSQCRRTLFNSSQESWLTLASLSFRRHRSSNKRPQHAPGGHSNRPLRQKKGFAPWNTESRVYQQLHIPQVDPQNIPAFFEEQVVEWSENPQLRTRLVSFGVPDAEVPPLLDAFIRAIKAGELSTPEAQDKYVLSRFVHHLDDGDPVTAIDIIYCTVLFSWAGDLAHAERLSSAGLSTTTIHSIQGLARTGRRWFPADEFPMARSMRRKVIMHVGPTNSGKTHNALRALAAAPIGVYAGPLRLLAHEIWERLNIGQIVPLGVEEEPIKPADPDTALDAPAVKRLGNPKYARPCNMITGEEHRIVEDRATLLSCTVEMIKTMQMYDVAVVDEIQMISDESRGSAWTSAVLGLSAKELHLCGEETAVPIIQALLKDTGDEVIVKRYNRLSPLHLEETSLEGDLSKVQKGDCIVTFSRSNIFAIKRRIETMTPLRCAVVYGRLPPEIRSEQAALFNDPDSGYDVMIGSDAIGMGLNLKIRRILFETSTKYDGARERPLSSSQIKQIAGRAGRYGLHGDNNKGGLVSAFGSKDLQPIRNALDAPPVPLTHARIGTSRNSFLDFYLALPNDAATKTVLTAHQYISMMPAHLRQERMSMNQVQDLCDFLDEHGFGLPMADRQLWVTAPIPYRDPAALEIAQLFIRKFSTTMRVDLWEVLTGSILVANLEAAEALMKDPKPSVHSNIISDLESLHKAVVVYVWMSFRRPMSWPCSEEVGELKERVEKALDWGLQTITRAQQGYQQQEWQQRINSQRETKTEGIAYKRSYGSSMADDISQSQQKQRTMRHARALT